MKGLLPCEHSKFPRRESHTEYTAQLLADREQGRKA